VRFGQREQDDFQPESRDSRQFHHADATTSLGGIDIGEFAHAAGRSIPRFVLGDMAPVTEGNTGPGRSESGVLARMFDEFRVN
jgi:hypothetical protein